jgi:hypothetical protein
MAKAGRKSYLEEMGIKQRYTDLSEPFFKVLKKFLNSEKTEDQKWAVEQLSKAYVKMIPQDLTSGGKEISVNVISYNANKNDTPQLPQADGVPA